MAVLELAPEFGYIALVLVASFILVHMYMPFKVMKARTKYGVEYPNLYSDKEPAFNCIQRVHQNSLETFPGMMLTTIVGGLMYPRVCALGGVIYILGRIAYAQGYYTGKPANRQKGAFGMFGMLINLACCGLFGLRLLGWM